jgi:hypothetical protein
MDAYMLLLDLRSRGIVLIPNGDRLTAEPSPRLSDADRAAIHLAKIDLLRVWSGSISASWQKGVTPNSRYPLVPPGVRKLSEGIEA